MLTKDRIKVQIKCKGESWADADLRNDMFHKQGHGEATNDEIKWLKKFREGFRVEHTCHTCEYRIAKRLTHLRKELKK